MQESQVCEVREEQYFRMKLDTAEKQLVEAI